MRTTYEQKGLETMALADLFNAHGVVIASTQ